MPAPSALPKGHSERARLHGLLTGLTDREADGLVGSAHRQAGSAHDPIRFWRALYRSLASISRQAEMTDPVATALAALPLEARTALLLRIGESMPPEAIAAALDEPEPRARRHLATALSALREALACGRADAEWITDVQRWLAAGPPPMSRPAPPSVATPPAAPSQAAPAPAASPRTSSLRLWLGLAVALATVGALRLWAEGDLPALRSEAPAPPPASPLETMLSLSDEDYALLADGVDLDALAQLDFLLWDAASDAR